jgi:hypothetical protein
LRRASRFPPAGRPFIATLWWQVRGSRLAAPWTRARFQVDSASSPSQHRSLNKRLKQRKASPDLAEIAARAKVPTLSDLVPRVRTRFTDAYDYGDCRKHLGEVVKIGPAQLGARYPRRTDGARANPIEDSGWWGFAEQVEAAGNPGHERLADLQEWPMEGRDPAKFSVEELNRELAGVFRPRK